MLRAALCSNAGGGFGAPQRSSLPPAIFVRVIDDPASKAGLLSHHVHPCRPDRRAWKRWSELRRTVHAECVARARRREGVPIDDVIGQAYTVPDVERPVVIRVLEVL